MIQKHVGKFKKFLSLVLSVAMVASPILSVAPVQAAPSEVARSYDVSDPMVATSSAYPTTYSRWMDGLLAGNGKQGIIVFGNPLDETVVYTDKDFFMARTENQPERKFNQVSDEDLEYIRKQLIAGQYEAANQRAFEVQGYSGGGEGSKHPGYKMTMKTNASGTVSNYMRATDYSDGIVYVNWTDDRGDWERESFVSREDDVTVQHQAAPAGQTFDMTLELSLDAGMHLTSKNLVPTLNNSEYFLNIRVKYPNGRYNAGYEGVTKIITDGTPVVDGNTVKITDASDVTLLTRTQRYNGTYKGGQPAETEWNQEKLQAELNAITKSYADLRSTHVAEHSEIMDRVTLDFDASVADKSKTNEQLIADQKASNTMVGAMYERLFYAGRYHTLGSAYEYGAPDLLGNWTGDADVGWDGYYHLDANLNLQISGANIGNMPEAMEGYKWLNHQWQEGFRINASKLLGVGGMLVGGNTPNGEGLISNINYAYPYQYVTGGMGWLLYPIWEEYKVTGDESLLEDYYTLARDMGTFYEDFLVETEEDGTFIFAGSISPETQPTNPPAGQRGAPLAINSVYDISGAKFSLETLIETAELLGKDAEKIPVWQDILDRLPEYIINDHGALSGYAWEDLKNKDDYRHRHVSGLMPVWPYQEITKETAPDLMAGAQEFLTRKDGGSYENAGHGLLHGAMVAAKLNDAKSVNAKLLRFVKDNYYYPSLSTAHYNTITPGVFCTDVANSVPTVLMEMLATTTEDTIELLPALPDGLPKGSIKGMLGKNQTTLDEITWDLENQAIKLVVTAQKDKELTLIQRAGIEEITSDQALITSSEHGSIARTISLQAGVETEINLKVRDASKVNLALNKPADSMTNSGQNTSDKAFDGDLGTRWGASQDPANWLQVDLEDTYLLNEVVLRWEDSYAKRYKIQVSEDGENWTDVYTQNNSSGGVEIIPLSNVAGRYVRMQSVEMSNQWGVSLWEMEVYGGPLPNLALNRPARAMTESSSNTKEKAFDGDPGTRWGAHQSPSNWIDVELDATYTIQKVVINWEDAYATKYILQTSDDGINWTDMFVQDNCRGGIEEIPITENNVGKYVRMQGVEMVGQWGYSIWEMEVYGTLKEDDELIEEGWIKDDNGWKYQLEDGTFLTNAWNKTDGLWYYLGEDGYLKTGWLQDEDKWYFLDRNSGAMKTGWLLDGKWYYLGVDGTMKTGWILDGEDYYFLDETNGTIVTGWVEDGADWYFMDYNTGIMATNEWIGSYWVGPDGKWDPNQKR